MGLVELFEILKERYPDLVHEIRFCQEHGEYQATSLGPDKPFSGCPECRNERIRQETIENILGHREDRTKDRLEREIPRRFRDKTFENYSVTVSPEARKIRDAVWDYAKNFRENRAKGRSLMLIGNPGTGKNHLAVSLVRVVILNGFKARMMDASDLIQRVKSTWNSQAREDENKAVKDLSKLDLLVINELGAIFNTEAEKKVLFKVINRRYDDMLPTVIMGNVNREKAEEILGKASYDRFKEDGGQVLVLNWKSYRDPQETTAPPRLID